MPKYTMNDDIRTLEILEIIEQREELKKFFLSMIELADEYIKEMYDLSTDSDIEEDEPYSPYEYSTDEDDY
jgi:hypothetical protein